MARYALLVVVYVASGKLGLMLALPPGYASAIFPPAGIAVAAALVWGRPALPWVFLGSFLLNLWTGFEAGHGPSDSATTAAIIIAGASAIQAAIGGYGLQRLVGWPAPLDNSRDVLRFLLSTPIICLVSATLSVVGLCTIGVIGAGQAAESWVTWWVGDTLGLIVMLPLVLVAVGEPRSLWRRRAPTVALPMMLVFALLVTFFFRVSKWEHEETLLEFRLLSQQTADRVQTQFEEQASLLEQLAGFFQAGRRVTREDFRRFVGKSLVRFPMIAALDWAPRIEAAQRPAFEAAMKREIPDFEIRERGPEEKLVRSATQSEYYPVAYTEPIEANRAALGFDLASNANRRMALLRSVESGLPVTSAPVHLVQDPNQERYGILLFLPVPGDGNGPGVVLTVIEMQSFMENLVASAGDRVLARFEDIDEHQVLYNSFTGDTRTAFERSFTFGTHSYRLQTAPTQFYLDHHRGWQSWSVLVAGILAVGLLGGLLLLGTGYTARVEATVVDRTRNLARSERQLKEAQRIAHVGSWNHDFQQDVLIWSDEIKRIYEVASDAFVPSYPAILAAVHPDDREQVSQLFAEAKESRNPYTAEHRLLFPDGRIKYVRVHGETSFDENGRPLRSMGTVQDVTERRLAEETLRKASKEIEDLYNNAPCGYHSLNADGVFVRINDTELKWLGYEREEVLGKMRFDQVITPESQAIFIDNFPTFKARGWVHDLEFEMVRKDGSTFTALINAVAISDAHGHYVMSRTTVFDITERKHAQEQIRQLAYYDTLTELPNRRLLLDRLQQAVAQARHFHRSMAVMFLDLDRFKKINDTLGHDVGDELLKAVAKQIVVCVRSGDTVSRQGGDEFVIVLAEIAHPEDAALVAEKIIAILEHPLKIRNRLLRITTSIGIAVYPVDGTDDVLALMKKADIAMYGAKKSGRNQYRFYNADFDPHSEMPGVN